MTDKCTCHERDSSYTCDYCKRQGFFGHMESDAEIEYLNDKVDEYCNLTSEFIRLLDIVEVSDMGTEFRPNTISSCRVFDADKIDKIIKRLKEMNECTS